MKNLQVRQSYMCVLYLIALHFLPHFKKYEILQLACSIHVMLHSKCWHSRFFLEDQDKHSEHSEASIAQSVGRLSWCAGRCEFEPFQIF